jgi:hypothetical protein
LKSGRKASGVSEPAAHLPVVGEGVWALREGVAIYVSFENCNGEFASTALKL